MKKLMTFLVLVAPAATLQAQSCAVTSQGILNGASFAVGQPVAPGSIVSIFGSNLARALALADTVPLSNALGGVGVSVSNIAAPLYFVSQGQVNAQIPYDVPPGTATMVVNCPDNSSSGPVTVNVAASAPGIFASGQWAIAINADGSLAASDGAIPGIATHPAAAGDALIILASGLGAVTPSVATGASSLDQLRTTVVTPTVLVGGRSAGLLFSGLSPQFPGVNQVNITVPAGAGTGVVPLQMQVGQLTTTDQVKIALR